MREAFKFYGPYVAGVAAWGWEKWSGMQVAAATAAEAAKQAAFQQESYLALIQALSQQ